MAMQDAKAKIQNTHDLKKKVESLYSRNRNFMGNERSITWMTR